MIYVLYAFCIMYFLFSRRKIDFYTLAAFSSLIYFAPGVVGYTFHVLNREIIYTPISRDMVFIYSAVLICLLSGASINDYVSVSTAKPLRAANRSKLRFLNLVALVIWGVFALVHSEDLFYGRKEEFGSLYAISFTAVTTSLVISLVTSSWRWIAAFFFIAAIDLYSGNREMIAFTAITFIFWVGLKSPPIRMFSYFRIILPAMAVISLLLIYKQLGAAVIAQRWDLVASRLGDPAFYLASVARSEPFATQSILYYAINSNWVYSESFLLNIAIILMPIGRIFSNEINSLSAFLNESFGDVGYGLGSNVWAEAFVLGGMPMVLIFAVFYATLPAVLNHFARSTNSLGVRIFVLFFAVAFLFFIHRTGVEYAFNLVKRYALYIFFTNLTYVFFVKASNR